MNEKQERKLEHYIVYELGETVHYCVCGHSALVHVSPPLDMTKSVDWKNIKTHCERCDCRAFR